MLGLNLSDPRFWLDLVQSLCVLWLFLRKPAESANERVTALAGEVAVIQERLKHVPSAAELVELEGTLKAVVAQLSGLDGQITATSKAVIRIEEFLRNHK